jgi:hypothetical protein
VVVREAAESARRQVGIGIGDLENSASLTFAFEEATLRKASLIAIHSWHLPESDVSRAGPIFDEPSRYVAETETAKRLEQLLDEWRAKYPDVPVSQDLVLGHPGRAQVGLSAHADLVVVGRRSADHGPASVMHAVLTTRTARSSPFPPLWPRTEEPRHSAGDERSRLAVQQSLGPGRGLLEDQRDIAAGQPTPTMLPTTRPAADVRA